MHQDGPSASSKTSGRAVAHPQDILTLTSHTNDRKTPNRYRPNHRLNQPHDDAVLLK